jgi:alkylhydroperoxidase/carboxymuconolactone decarboxylase family protein YurZ
MGRITISDVAAKTEAVNEAPDDFGRRFLIKTGLAASILTLWQAEPSWALENRMSNNKKHDTLPAILTMNDVNAVSPALAHYTEGPLLNGLWKRPKLSPRDRSVVTVAALIARIQVIEMPYHFALALDNGVKPAELSEIITHLAFYARWANAMSAVAIAKDIFHQQRRRDGAPARHPRTKVALGRRSLAGSIIGGIAETQEVIDFCTARNITADVEMIKPSEINTAYDRVVNKDVRYRFVIDMEAKA